MRPSSTPPAGPPRNTLIDEIRQLSHDVFLGMGTRETEDGGRSEPGYFVLVGPTDEWVGVD